MKGRGMHDEVGTNFEGQADRGGFVEEVKPNTATQSLNVRRPQWDGQKGLEEEQFLPSFVRSFLAPHLNSFARSLAPLFHLHLFALLSTFSAAST
jgi:hypothetical protein